MWNVHVQGHFQIVLNNDHCPLFQKDLSWFQRLMYCSGVWAYIVGAITTPMFIIIPLVRLTCPDCMALTSFSDKAVSLVELLFIEQQRVRVSLLCGQLVDMAQSLQDLVTALLLPL